MHPNYDSASKSVVHPTKRLVHMGDEQNLVSDVYSSQA